MGAIEDTRKVLQDFLAPKLRAISARLGALEKKVKHQRRRSTSDSTMPNAALTAVVTR